MPNSITELRDFILKNVQDFHHHVSRPSYRYRKPYPAWIDSVPFPPGYELSHILASQTIQTFEELCSKAHDLEAQILRKKGKKEEGKAGTSATIAMVETNKANKAPVLLKAQAKEKELVTKEEMGELPEEVDNKEVMPL
nr:hypothetical protein CFP56_78049 [Quercus suber]